MWMITTIGFFSVVEKIEDKADGMVTVRSRVRADLEKLNVEFLGGKAEIIGKGGTDYPYRLRIPKGAWADAAGKLADGIDYPNFKSAVHERQGGAREQIYEGVWNVLKQLHSQEMAGKAGSVVHEVSGAEVSYGGVVFNEKGEVLLRKPTNEFDGYVWTFPKGKREGPADPEVTAKREVLEETGFEGEIIGKVPGSFMGGTGSNEYFLMIPIARKTDPDPAETAEIRWASPQDAARLIARTRNSVGRKRDLEVLQAALDAWKARLGFRP